MSQRRSSAFAGVVGGRLVVAGGLENDLGLLSSAELPGTGWTPAPAYSHSLLCHGVRAEQAAIYVSGMGSNKLQVLEMTEENGLAWTVKADLLNIVGFTASTVHEGKVWLMGGMVGRENSASVLTYDVEADAWATLRRSRDPS